MDYTFLRKGNVAFSPSAGIEDEVQRYILFVICVLFAKNFFIPNILTLNPPPIVSLLLRSARIPLPFPFKCSLAIFSPLIKLLISFS